MGLGRSLDRINKHAHMRHLEVRHKMEEQKISTGHVASFIFDGLANPTVVQFPAFCYALCDAEHSRAEQKGPCKPYSQSVVQFAVFYLFAVMQGTPEHTNRRIANPTVVQLSTFYHALCYAQHS